ncbi:MAG: hypothetical protein ABI465_07165 [Ktedonobacteraceae bacterium]
MKNFILHIGCSTLAVTDCRCAATNTILSQTAYGSAKPGQVATQTVTPTNESI